MNDQIALDFAREIMGWKDAYQSAMGLVETMVVEGQDAVIKRFNQYSLEEVIDAAENWCDANKAKLVTVFEKGRGMAMVFLPGDDDSQDMGEGTETRNEAIMMACLEAQRRSFTIKET